MIDTQSPRMQAKETAPSREQTVPGIISGKKYFAFKKLRDWFDLGNEFDSTQQEESFAKFEKEIMRWRIVQFERLGLSVEETPEHAAEWRTLVQAQQAKGYFVAESEWLKTHGDDPLYDSRLQQFLALNEANILADRWEQKQEKMKKDQKGKTHERTRAAEALTKFRRRLDALRRSKEDKQEIARAAFEDMEAASPKPKEEIKLPKKEDIDKAIKELEDAIAEEEKGEAA